MLNRHSLSSLPPPVLITGMPIVAFALLLLLPACDHGLKPPPETPFGVISGTIDYAGDWPSADSLRDLRFVAFRFVPQDTTDFFRLNEFVFSSPLRLYVHHDAFVIDSVEAGPYVYNGVAQKFGPNPLDWRPIGLFSDDGGTFIVPPYDTVRIHLTVDFQTPPPFPPNGYYDRD